MHQYDERQDPYEGQQQGEQAQSQVQLGSEETHRVEHEVTGGFDLIITVIAHVEKPAGFSTEPCVGDTTHIPYTPAHRFHRPSLRSYYRPGSVAWRKAGYG